MRGNSTPNPDVRSPTALRWQIVGLLVLYSFMTWFNRVSMSVAYDEQIKEQSGISPEQMGTIYSTFLFTYMVCMTPGGWLIDRFGPWLALAVMGVGSALFGALTGVAGMPALGLLLPALFVVRALMGMLSAPVYPACSRIVAHWMPLSQRAFANGLVQGAAAVGISCTFPVFGALIDWLDWQTAFLITGSVTLLVAVAWIVRGADYPWQHRLAVPKRVEAGPLPLQPALGTETGITAESLPLPPMEDSSRPAPTTVPAGLMSIAIAETPWWTLLADRSLMLLTLSYAAVGYVEYLFFFWMHYYFEDVLHFGKDQSRIYAAILTMSMAVGMVVGGWLADRLRAMTGSRKSTAVVPALGLCAGGGLLVAGVLVQETVWIVTLLALALAAVGATEAPVWTMAVELGRRHGGTAAAICNTGGNAGGLLAPIVTPFVGGWLTANLGVSVQAGWQLSISLGSAIAIGGAVLWLWITPPEQTPAGLSGR
jgi:ACS family D-galactonate transporter-like MFS transporter